jgi:hypothetical protein
LEPNSEGGGGEVTVPSTPSYTTPSSMQHQALTSSPRGNSTNTEIAPPPEALQGTLDVTDLEDIQYPESKEATSSTEYNKDGKQGIEIKGANETKAEVKTEVKTEIKPVSEKKGLNAKLPDSPKVETTTEKKATPEELKSLEKATAEARDYSIFPEEYRDELKKTSNTSFKFLTETYLKSKKQEEELTSVKKEVENIQKGGFPSQWYEHPEAWRLHPVAQKGINTLDRIAYEESFLRDQLGKIENGEKWQYIKGYTKDGTPVYSELLEPSKEIATDIVLNLGKMGAAKQQEAIRLNHFAQSFSQSMNGLGAEVDKIIDQEFPWRKDEKHECHKWVTEFKEVTQGILPNSKATDLCSYLYAALNKTKEMLAEAQKTVKTTEIKQETKQKIEPSVKSPSVNGAPKSGPTAKPSNGTYMPPAKFDMEGMLA